MPPEPFAAPSRCRYPVSDSIERKRWLDVAKLWSFCMVFGIACVVYAVSAHWRLTLAVFAGLCTIVALEKR